MGGVTDQGDVAQMVERMLSMHEAQGSIPCFSTFFFTTKKNSSQWPDLNRRPFLLSECSTPKLHWLVCSKPLWRNG